MAPSAVARADMSGRVARAKRKKIVEEEKEAAGYCAGGEGCLWAGTWSVADRSQLGTEYSAQRSATLSGGNLLVLYGASMHQAVLYIIR